MPAFSAIGFGVEKGAFRLWHISAYDAVESRTIYQLTMQNKLLPVLLAATFFAAGVHAQNATQPASATPSTQAVPASQPSAPPATAPAPQPVVQSAPPPNQVIYAPRLPTATELTQIAAAKGQTVEQINQTSTQITAIYQDANGQRTTVAYQLLPTATSAPSTTVVVPSPAPRVVYRTSPRVIYYDDPFDDDYYPGYYYPPVSLSFGFGFSHWDHDDWDHDGWGRGGWGRGGWGHRGWRR